MRGRLLEVDELYVGRPALGAVFAYRDASGDILADVEVLHTETSKLNALVSGEPMRHVDERWVVAEHGKPVFFVERYGATADSSYAVFDPEGAPLGTFLSEGGVKRHFDSGGEIGIVLLELVPPVGLAVVAVERTLDGLYWLRRRLD